MNKQAFLNIVRNPDNISSKDLEGLDEVISNLRYAIHEFKKALNAIEKL